MKRTLSTFYTKNSRKLVSKNTSYAHHKGFTLIEILVVFTIIAILFGVGIANYRDFSRRQAVRSAARKVEADLNLARQMANSGTKPTNTSGIVPAACQNIALGGYTFNVHESGTQYNIRAVCGNLFVNIGKDNIALPQGVAISPTLSYTRFKTLRQGTNLTSARTFSIVGAGTTAQVVVETSGQVRLVD